MKLLAEMKEAIHNLYFAKLRTTLALLGILVGTASVVAMVLGGQLATNEALKQFKTLGTDLLAVSINATHEEPNKPNGQKENLTLPAAMGLTQADSQIISVAPYSQLYLPAFWNGKPLNATLLGVTSEFPDIVKIRLKAGRFISTLDHYAYYCVIGHAIYEEIKNRSSKEPLGQVIQIGKNLFVVVGVAAYWPENSFVYASIDNSIMVPLEASATLSKYAAIDNIVMRLAPHANIEKSQAKITTYLSNQVQGKTLNFRSAKELIQKMKNQSDILTIFLGLIGSISLLVGGIGVMNIMLVSVIERRREIGIRMAVGARRIDIAVLFLIESVMLSLLGGILGVIIGLMIAYLIALFSHWEFIIALWPPLIGFSVSVLVGIISGFYPAYLASKLDPIEVLRLD